MSVSRGKTLPVLTGCAILALCSVVLASSGEAEGNYTHHMAMLALQLGVIVFAAKTGGELMKRLKLPSVLGEMVAGMLIGPYALGALGLPGLPHGLFASGSGSLPISFELYGFATIASIILLFMAGLETDLKLFLRFSLAGTVVGVGGVVVSFVVGCITATMLLDIRFMDPRALFLGVMSTATSMGITVWILSEKKRLDSPEGVTLLAGAVIDDILGIILLAIIVGISAIGDTAGAHHTDWGAIATIGLKAVGVWLGFTVAGLLFADRIARLLKVEKSFQMIAVMSLGLALILAGLFEMAGLAMIIGAYVMGLSLSKTEINLSIIESMGPVQKFFIPIFFAVMGMLVNVRDIFSRQSLIIGGLYTLGAIGAKVVGCGLPSLFLNFNKLGALRIGVGMIPRGEVALIIAGVGLAHGILDQGLFSIAVMMTLVTTLIAPVVLSSLLTIPRRGTRKEVMVSQSETQTFDFPNRALAELVEQTMLRGFLAEGFNLHRLENEEDTYHLQKEHTLILFYRNNTSLSFESSREEQFFVKSLLYEMLLELHTVVSKVKDVVKPESLKRDLALESTARTSFDFGYLFKVECITMHLQARTKEQVIDELLQLLHENSIITDFKTARRIIMEREAAISTGMQYGVALPHGRIDEVDDLHVAVGFSREGIDFGAMDGKKCHVFILTVVPQEKKVPYVQFLAALSSHLNSEEKVQRLLSMEFRQDVIAFFCGHENGT